jgi:hypothetical protein
MAIYNEEHDANVLALDTTKKDLISEIKEIIDNYGSFGVGEVEADCSPEVPDQRGNLTHLIEYFNMEMVVVNVYGNWDNSIDEYTMSYEELDIETLEEIFELAQKWEELNNEE